MSFGFAIGDFIILSQLASRVVQGARQACGAHDELTREVASLHVVLRMLEQEISKPNSILHSAHEGHRRNESARLVQYCNKVLQVLEKILNEYNGLSGEQKRAKKLWKRVKFGNGEMVELSKIRIELATHTNAITIFLNLLSVGSAGRIEEQLSSQNENWRDLRESIHWITASLQATSGQTEGSILTSYSDDDKLFWKELRRELVQEGYSSRTLKKYKNAIQNYVKELGDRGALDSLGSLEDVNIKDSDEPDKTPIREGIDEGNCTNDPRQKKVSRQITNPEPSHLTASGARQKVNHNSPNPILPFKKSESSAAFPSNKFVSDGEVQNAGEPFLLNAGGDLKETSFYDHSDIGDPKEFMIGFVFVSVSDQVSIANQISLHTFAARYIESTECKDWRPKPRLVRLRADESHIRSYDLPSGTKISRWDPNYKPFLLQSIAFDHFSFGKWLYDWDVERWGVESDNAKSSARVWVALSKLSSVAHLSSNTQNKQGLREWEHQAEDLLQGFGELFIEELRCAGHTKSENSAPDTLNGHVPNFLPTENSCYAWADKMADWHVGFDEKWSMAKKRRLQKVH